MSKSKYWPLDYDPEGEIYDNLAWDLPGFRRERRKDRNRKIGRNRPSTQQK